MDAPERIWAYSDGLWIEAWDAPPSGAEYIRADLMAELVEALRGMIANANAAAIIKGKQHIIVCTEEEWNAHVAATERACAALAKIKEPQT